MDFKDPNLKSTRYIAALNRNAKIVRVGEDETSS